MSNFWLWPDCDLIVVLTVSKLRLTVSCFTEFLSILLNFWEYSEIFTEFPRILLNLLNLCLAVVSLWYRLWWHWLPAVVSLWYRLCQWSSGTGCVSGPVVPAVVYQTVVNQAVMYQTVVKPAVVYPEVCPEQYHGAPHNHDVTAPPPITRVHHHYTAQGVHATRVPRGVYVAAVSSPGSFW